MLELCDRHVSVNGPIHGLPILWCGLLLCFCRAVVICSLLMWDGNVFHCWGGDVLKLCSRQLPGRSCSCIVRCVPPGAVSRSRESKFVCDLHHGLLLQQWRLRGEHMRRRNILPERIFLLIDMWRWLVLSVWCRQLFVMQRWLF